MARALYSRLIEDGKFGPVTILALQIYMRSRQGTYLAPLRLDGIWGPQTVRGMQRWMQKQGYYRGYYVDGTYGDRTKEEFSRMVRTRYSSITAYPSGAVSLLVSDSACRGLQKILNYYRFV